MRINAMNVVIGAGLGVADEVGEKWDSDRGNSDAFTGILGWSRIGVTLAAYAGQAFNFQPEFCKTVAQSTIPLATKTVVKSIIQATGGGTATSTKTNRATSVNVGGGKVAWRPVPIG
ncbi:hypothetical protein LCGC14_0607350 [marine sediment metagenome]|uniref:Uncharacterized protein n=1 Tax=marine sediment metagenome TaxID=412755 RepID=A0A0F9RDH2_9ZZZZ